MLDIVVAVLLARRGIPVAAQAVADEFQEFLAALGRNQELHDGMALGVKATHVLWIIAHGEERPQWELLPIREDTVERLALSAAILFVLREDGGALVSPARRLRAEMMGQQHVHQFVGQRAIQDFIEAAADLDLMGDHDPLGIRNVRDGLRSVHGDGDPDPAGHRPIGELLVEPEFRQLDAVSIC